MTFNDPTNNKQLAREARIGFTVIGLLLVVFLFVAFKRLSGGFQSPFPEDARVASLEISDDETDGDSDDLWGRSEDNLNFDDESLETSEQKSAKTNVQPPQSPSNIVQSRTSNELPNSQGFVPNNPSQFSGESKLSTSNTLDSHDQVYVQKPDGDPSDNSSTWTLPFTNRSNDPKALEPRPPERSVPPHLVSTGVNVFSDSTNESTNLGPADSANIEIPENLSGRPANGVESDVSIAKKDNPFSRLEAPSQFDLKDSQSDPQQNSNALRNKVVPQNEDSFVQKIPGVDRSKPNQVQLTNGQFQPNAGVEKRADDAVAGSNDQLKPADKRLVPPCKVIAHNQTSYWSLAQEAYGDGNLFRALHQHNKIAVGLVGIRPGVELDIPEESVLRKNYPEYVGFEQTPVFNSGSSRQNKSGQSEQSLANDVGHRGGTVEYVTEEGETVFSISAERLGQAARYVEILKLNVDRLPTGTNQQSRLRAGLRILLPAR